MHTARAGDPARPWRTGRQLKAAPCIMFVDDEIDITETYGIYLEYHGFEVITANSATDALAMLETRLPELIVSDCMMPLVDGIEFSRRLKARPATRDIPLILTSGAPYFHDLSSPTYDVFLLKPVAMPRLIAEIGRLLATRPAR
jgi:CheY-like chemotaxis protein